MLISLNEIKKYVQIPAEVTDPQLLELIGSRLVEIEEAIDLAPKYQGIYIVKVATAEKIPDTHLSLCQIDAGGQKAELANEDGLIQVVCGAPNVHAGMLAVWIAPGSIVPQTYGHEDFKLSVRKLRGYDSNGMLAALDELDLGTDHDGIVEIEPKGVQPGDSFAEKFDLNDLIIDVENKSLTHRPDCFGLIGFAREVAGILGLAFTEPVWPTLPQADKLPIDVKVTDSELCPRYTCAVFDLPKHEKSKYLTPDEIFLAKAGMRSIDPMVDLTNIIMLQTGQPLHAFDYDKLVQVGSTAKVKIIVRSATDGETIQLLDGKTIECIPEDILITSNNVPIALAGAMGGKNTEIDASTKRVVLESATFSLYHLRKTQMAHGIFSEAITRFTKGQPAAMTAPVLAETIQRLGVAVLATDDEWGGDQQQNVVKITTSTINELLGTNYPLATITKTLENVGFTVKTMSEMPAEASKTPAKASKAQTAVPPTSDSKTPENALLEVTAPAWRTDIHIPEDVIEEVGRLLGYDNIQLELPRGPFSGTEIAPMLQLKNELRSLLSDRLHLHELLTYSFISRQLLEKAGQDPAASYEIVNSISPELQCFRQQIVPSLLDKVRENIKAGHQAFTIYELNQVANRQYGLDSDGVPILHTDLGVVSLSDFYQLKLYLLTALRDGLKLDIEYSALAPKSAAAKEYPYLEPAHSAVLLVNGEIFGAFGEIKASVARKFKLEGTLSAAEICLDQIVDLPRRTAVTTHISKFPSVERDLTLKVAENLPFGRVQAAIDHALQTSDLIYQITPLSIYQAQADDATKNLSFHLKFSSPTATLSTAEITAIMEQISVEVAQVGATIV